MRQHPSGAVFGTTAMMESDSDAPESIDTEPRTVRALTEYHSVLADVGSVRDAPDMFTVVSQSGKSYTVDSRSGSCTCPDATHNLDVEASERCKHARRVAFATGERAIPAGVATAVDVDPDLGQHVDGSLRFVAADGGIIEASDRPEDCECGEWNDGLSLPCWSCYRDGFKEPNPNGDE